MMATGLRAGTAAKRDHMQGKQDSGSLRRVRRPRPGALAPATLHRELQRRNAALARAVAIAARSAGVDAVHQSRVRARHLRSALRTLEPLLDPVLAARLLRDLRGLALEFEAIRAADVRARFLCKVARDVPGVPPGTRRELEAILHAEQVAARERLAARIALPAWGKRLARLAATVASPRLVAAEGALAPQVRRRLGKQWRKTRSALRDAGDDVDALHAARIRAKRARYSFELLLPLLGLDPRPWTRAVKPIQACLGRHHDAADALVWLGALGEPLGPVLLGHLRQPLHKVQRRGLADARRLQHRLPRFQPRAAVPG
jgi:CHAD domain-containing protein